MKMSAYVTAIVFAGLAIAASVFTPAPAQTPVFTLIGTLAGYVLAAHNGAALGPPQGQ